MEPHSTQPLFASTTAWEDKERAGRLAKEKPRWRLLRLEAENPSATAATFTELMRGIYIAWGSDTRIERNYPDLVVEAIIAHPNTPPDLLLELVNDGYTGKNPPLRFFAVALCRNPIAPFVSLEVPNFWERMKPAMCQRLLSEANVPPSVVSQLAHHSNRDVVESARLHTAVRGNGDQVDRQDDSALAEGMSALARHEMQPDFDIELLHDWGEDFSWVNRFKSALNLPADEAAFTCDLWNRSPLDLLNHLARDGNRLVRSIAQNRLADPAFTFTWDDANKSN